MSGREGLKKKFDTITLHTWIRRQLPLLLTSTDRVLRVSEANFFSWASGPSSQSERAAYHKVSVIGKNCGSIVTLTTTWLGN